MWKVIKVKGDDRRTEMGKKQRRVPYETHSHHFAKLQKNAHSLAAMLSTIFFPSYLPPSKFKQKRPNYFLMGGCQITNTL